MGTIFGSPITDEEIAAIQSTLETHLASKSDQRQQMRNTIDSLEVQNQQLEEDRERCDSQLVEIGEGFIVMDITLKAIAKKSQ